MANDFRSARFWAQEMIEQAMFDGARVVDATMGNGHDTQWLCELVGESGRVYAFDVQPEAVRRTEERLTEADLISRTRLFCAGHERMAELVPEPVDAAVFNLGWLPGAEHGVTTRVETTIQAVNAALTVLKEDGIMTVCIYPGHEEGARELDALLDWAQGLDSARYSAMVRRYVNQSSCPPVLFAIGKNLTRRKG